MKNQQYLISIPAAAAVYGIGRTKLYELVNSDNSIPAVKVGAYTKLNRKLFEQWLDEATIEGKEL
mgnify:CR=1 FL=1